jgi:Transposase DNA-binding
MRTKNIHPSQCETNSSDAANALRDKDWIDQETASCHFSDLRLNRRFGKLLGQMGEYIGSPVPMACQDWANTKAAYRFFSSDRVHEAEILAGHLDATRERVARSDGSILVLHDTTEFIFKREKDTAIGLLHRAMRGTGAGALGRPQPRTICGLLMHSSLAVTTEGLPLGLAAVKFWTRKEFKGCNALKKKINPTRIPIEEKESFRWLENLRQATALLAPTQRLVHIADREGDIYELFCAAEQVQTHFLIRTCVDRLANDGDCTVAVEMKKAPKRGVHRLMVKDKDGEPSEAVLEIKYRRIRVLPPIGKQSQYPELTLTVLHAVERGKPKNREKIDWKLITNLPVESLAQAIEKLKWYAMRWKIEIFHKILKSGCRVEESKLRTAERLVNLIAVCCVVGWRIFWMTMLQRTDPKASPLLALTEVELLLLDEITAARLGGPSNNKTLADYLLCIARLGGYLARAKDKPPGNTVLWRGLSRLTHIQLGFAMGAKLVGN